jgi:tRNA pseudouridine55 synthase
MNSQDFTRQSVRRVERRNLHGVLLLDKPHGWSSNDALHQVKRLLNAKKAGHTGTLDPLATGLLPLCFGEATKFSSDLLNADKTYEASIRLGVTRVGGDLEGAVLQERPISHDAATLAGVLQRFTGQITQVPPMHSALKKDGVALYELARKGLEVERAPRAAMVHALTLLKDAGDTIDVRVQVSKGTYIRTLGEDIGEALGCGAHLVALRRTAVGKLNIADAVTLEALKAVDDPAALLLPVDTLVQDLQPIALCESDAQRVLQGQRLAWTGAEQGAVRMMGLNRFLGVAHIEAGRLQPVRILNFD